MHIVFTASAHKDYLWWQRKNPKTFERIQKLCKEILRKPFEGIGKPEALKYDLQGYWSRRIDTTHRLVYCVEEDRITIISCRYHY